MSLRTLSQQKLSASNYAKIKAPRPKGSVSFPGGGGNYLSIGSTPNIFGFGTADYTVEAWIKPSNYGTSQVITGGNSGTWAFRLGSGYGGNLNGLMVTKAQQADYDSCSYTFTAGTWYHVAVTRASAVVSFFINGAKFTTGNQSGTYNWTAENTAAIGNNGSNGEPYFGSVSNLRVVKGTALYTSSFTAPTTGLYPVSGTSLLTCQSPTTFTDYSPNNWSINVIGSPTVSSTSPFA